MIIPALNESTNIVATLQSLQAMRARGVKVIVVDGDSEDDTVTRATTLCDTVIRSPRGRARQMHAGAGYARDASALCFLHADSALPANADLRIVDALARGYVWGRFDVQISGTHFMLPVIAWFMNHRSRLSGIATGDQAIFITRASYDEIGGFPDQPLMEDVELTSRLTRTYGRVACAAINDVRVRTSGRRWEKHGVWRTILLMWSLRFRYWRGGHRNNVAVLKKQYDGDALGN